MLPLTYYLSLSMGRSFFTFDSRDIFHIIHKSQYETQVELKKMKGVTVDPYAKLKGCSAQFDQNVNLQGNFHVRYTVNKFFFDSSLFFGGQRLSVETHYDILALHGISSKVTSNIIYGLQLKIGWKPQKSQGIYFTTGVSDIILNIEELVFTQSKQERQHYATPFWGIGLEVSVTSRCRVFTEFQHKLSASGMREKDKHLNVFIRTGKLDNGGEMGRLLGHDDPKVFLTHWRFLVGAQIQIGGERNVD